MTGLPDTTKIKEVGRILAPNSAGSASSGTMTSCGGVTGCTLPGGFHTVFPYRLSDGRTLLFATTLTGTYASILDTWQSSSPAPPDQGLVARVPVPGSHGAVSRLLRRI